MSDMFQLILTLVQNGEIRISEHGYDELAKDGLSVREVIAGIGNAVVIENYPNYHKGPSVLLLQRDQTGAFIHVVWGIPKGHAMPAVLVTAYRPDPVRWTKDFMRRI